MSDEEPNRLPVNRLAGYQATVPRQNRAPSQRARAERLESLRNQLRFSHAIADSTLRWYLTRNNWEVNRAAQAFWESEEAAEQGQPTQAPAPAQRRADNLEQSRIFQTIDQAHAHHTTQQERLLALRNVRTRSGRLPRLPIPPQPEPMSNASTAILLHDRQWVPQPEQDDLMGIIAAQTARQHDRQTLQDRIERTLARHRLRPRGRMQKDERLALFLSIAPSNSWHSCRKLLSRRRYDLAMAIEEWMKSGGVPVIAEPLTVRRHAPILKCGGMRPTNVNNSGRAINGTFKTFPMDQKTKGLSREDRVAARRHAHRRLQRRMKYPALHRAGAFRNYFKGSRYGYLLDDRGVNNRPAYVGSPDASKLWLEYVRRGILKVQRFPSKMPVPAGRGRKELLPFRWHDGPETMERHVEFDWFNSAHISRLNKWRAHRQAKITSTIKRCAPLPFNKYELQWITEQEAMRIEEQFYHEAGQDALDVGITNQGRWDRAMRKFSDFTRYPIRLSGTELTDLTERFNTTFAGKRYYTKTIVRDSDGLRDVHTTVEKDMKKVGFVPRPPRTQTVIAQQRRRIKTSSKHFLLSINSQKDADKNRFCDEFTSEEDSDFADNE